MVTSKENYLLAAHGEKPEWVPSFEEEACCFSAPIWDVDPETGTDFMSVKWMKDEYGKMPDANRQAMHEISEWHDIVKFPDLDKLDWEALATEFFSSSEADRITICRANTAGIFLIPINMMGWVDGLCALYDDPDELKAFIERITEFLCEEIGYFGRFLHPHIVFSGDDLASAAGPFVSREDFVSFYKPSFQKICDAIHDIGALAEFHNCGNNGYLIEEVIDIGFDICQLPIPNEGLQADKKKYGKRLVITGGWDRHGEGGLPNASEEAVRASVRKAIDDFGSEGGLIFWDGGIIGKSEDSRRKKEWLLDELHVYGAKIYQ